MNGPLVNGSRGEVGAVLGGKVRRLCLTLGALAEMETAFDVVGGEALAARLANPGAADLITIIGALLRGGGSDIAPGVIASFNGEDAMAAAVAAFDAATAE